jgi:hypothetical protein
VTYGKNLANFGLLENPLYGLNGFFTVMLQKKSEMKRKYNVHWNLGPTFQNFKHLSDI